MARRAGMPVVPIVLLGASAFAGSSCSYMRSFARIGPLVEQEFAVDAGDARSADVHVSFYGGEIRVVPGEGDRIVGLTTLDNLEEFEARCEERRDDGHVTARLWVESEKYFKVTDADDVTHEWLLSLSRTVPISLELGLASCEGKVDLGGVALHRVAVKFTAGEMSLRFSQPVVGAPESLRLEAGAGRFTVEQLGNARCRSIEIEAGAGELEVDCHGDWPESALLRIESGVADVSIRVPRELAVELDTSRMIFGEIHAPDFTVDKKSWFSTPEASTATRRLKIELEASIGTVTVVRD